MDCLGLYLARNQKDSIGFYSKNKPIGRNSFRPGRIKEKEKF
jgi:hypothetical protein